MIDHMVNEQEKDLHLLSMHCYDDACPIDIPEGGVEDLEKADVYLRWLIESAAKEEVKNVH